MFLLMGLLRSSRASTRTRCEAIRWEPGPHVGEDVVGLGSSVFRFYGFRVLGVWGSRG